MGKIVIVETSCGRRFEHDVGELSDRQLLGLLRNADDPEDIVALRVELQRRKRLQHTCFAGS
jgi:hypothetical protein